MKRFKKAVTLCIGAALGASSLTGCYSKVTSDNYDTTAVATFGDETIYLNEVNYYVKMFQVTYDSYFDYFYQPYYGFSTKKEFYEYTGMTDNGSTIWEALKEDAMAAVMQTYILDFHAQEYGVSLTEDDKKKIEDAVEEFLSETDPGIVAACMVDKDDLIEIYTRNALANKVWEYMVSDIDTSVNEEDFRYTEVAYLAITEASDDTSSNDAESTEDEAVDLKSKADEVLASLKEQMSIYTESGEDDDSIPYNAVIADYEDEKDIKITYTASKQYNKPEADEETGETAESLQSICWSNLKTGEYTTWYDEDNQTSYVVYCVDDDVEESKESAIESELDSRRDEMFNSKYPDVVKNSPTFEVKSRVYKQLKYEEISYETVDGVDTSGNDVSDND